MLSHTNLIINLESRFKKEPDFIQVMLGPRQVGKTTAIKEFLKSYKGPFSYYSADEILSPDPIWINLIWNETIQKNKNSLLIIDEIQKVHDWQTQIKKLWDKQIFEKNSSLKILLTGSSSLNIQKGLSESLTGRFEIIRAHHFSFEQSKKDFNMNIEQYLKYGGYPGSYKLIKDENRWKHYINESVIETVVNKDILLHNRVKSPALFKQAFELITSYPAQEISYNKLLCQLQDKGNVDLIKYYIELFEDAYLIKAISKYSKSEFKKKGSSPKIIPLCPALINRSLYQSKDLLGRVFEAIVGATLVKAGLEFYYWREGNYEVDYVVKEGKNLWGIEVKYGEVRSVKGLQHFLKSFSEAKILVINLDNYQKFEKDPLKFLKGIQ